MTQSTKNDLKQDVKVATTANIDLNGIETIDGVLLVAGDRVLVKNQTTASQNGIYIVRAGAWTRAIDASSSSEVTTGQLVYVAQGTTQDKSLYVLSTTGAIVLGTTNIAYELIAAVA